VHRNMPATASAAERELAVREAARGSGALA
jgi:hypothetical protein